MRIVVDFDRCQSNAVCVGIAPSIFELREDGFLYLLDETPGEEVRALVEEAIVACPTQALAIVEE